MRLTELRLENLRNIAALELQLGPGINLFVGPNGAGKTSILEGAYLLSHAQSFRTGLPDHLIRRGSERLIAAAAVERLASPIRLGLARATDGWQARVNGAPVPTLGSLLREFALVCFEPGSHALISGPSSLRRRFLDWGVFHVEPEFLGCARHYARALRQRNAALKQAAAETELAAWDAELAAAADLLTRMRRVYFARYAPELTDVLAIFLPELGPGEIHFSAGSPEDIPLTVALERARGRDRARGHTSVGPHRADWGIVFAGTTRREHLSRGQEKLCALACVLAQARLFVATRGEWPVIALDDLASELDAAHQAQVVQMLGEAQAQILISGIEIPDALRRSSAAMTMFHVEHGELRGLL